MLDLLYQKRKNTNLFKELVKPEILFLSNIQNYIPIYTRFFTLNETNYNNINLNNQWFISNISSKIDEDIETLFKCDIQNKDTSQCIKKDVFFKMAPLLDPYKYMIGKYDITNPHLFNLPNISSTGENCNPKILDVNNSAYVDGFFLFLLSKLKHTYNFIHGLDHYCSFLAIKNNFKLNVYDDIEYLDSSEFFNKNKNSLFTVDEYKHLFQEEPKMKPLHIGHNISLKSFDAINDELFSDVFGENVSNSNKNNDLVDITKSDSNITINDVFSLRSTSTCSSRTSHTNDEDQDDGDEDGEDDGDQDDGDEDGEDDGDEDGEDDGDEDGEDDGDDGDDGDEDGDDDGDEDGEGDDEEINVIIPKFPIQLIGMEYCEDTFDNLILENDLTTDEWTSAFMQIIMILITYQKAFHFTHNDLHTNNVMYNKTHHEYLYYIYNKKIYKVPTFGRLFKIIDFGRSIFKFDGKLFCSDSFKVGGDAATQYNIEPYFDEKKPRLEPNFSFDLCRLACSIFDYVVDNNDMCKNVSNICDPIQRIITEWCLDDNGLNMLYKTNGQERYPEFKLYKMIARCVHNHTPQSQLERPEFKKYIFNEKTPTLKNKIIMNIDDIPIFI